MKLAVFSSIFLLSVCACTALEVGRSEEAIVDGTRETGEPAVVFVYNRFRGGLCTGALIAPRVVLTAKHCVQEAGAAGPANPSAFIVGIGDSVNGLSQTYTTQSIYTTPGVYSSNSSTGLGGALVGQDAATVVLTRGATVTPFEIRRDRATDQIAQTVTLIGFGQTPAGGTGVKYTTTVSPRSIMGNNIYYSAGICQGDSGGPMIQADRRVIGVASFGTGACGSGYSSHNLLDNYLDIIDMALNEVGTCLNDGAEVCDGHDNDCDEVVDEDCKELGETCTDAGDCVGGVDGSVCVAAGGAGTICTLECDPLRPAIGCPPSMYCVGTGGCSGVCALGEAGSLGNDAICTSDTECASLHCNDPGDGTKRCLTPCRGDSGMCLAGESCAALSGSCGSCVPASRVFNPAGRGLGEPCDDGSDCMSDTCMADAGGQYCTRACTDDGGCSDGFHCRDDECARGPRQGVGGSCSGNGDCSVGQVCASESGRRWCASFCDVRGDDCPDDFTCVAAGSSGVCAPERGILGDACGGDDDCISGVCRDGICTQECGAAAPCGPGYECVRGSDGVEALCRDPSSTTTSTEGGCSVSRRSSPFFLLLALISVAALARRRILCSNSML